MLCSNCGREIGDDAVFCPYCGYAVYEEDVQEIERMREENQRRPAISAEEDVAPKKRTTSRKNGNGMVVILAVIAVCLIGLLFYVGANIVRNLRGNDDEGVLVAQETPTPEEDEITLIPEESPIVTDIPTSTPRPTDTPMPTFTPIPTNTPTPEPTSTPTTAPAPTNTPVPTTTPAPASSNSYVIANSSSAYLSESQLSSLSSRELRIARNEIFARHGRKFDDQELQSYFNNQSWYNGTIAPSAFDPSVLNDYEIKNLDLIKKVEASR